VNHLKSGMDSLLTTGGIESMFPNKDTRRDPREHNQQPSAYDQFAQEYPQLDEYGRKVASGRQFKETMGTLAGALNNSSGMAGGEADTGAGNILDYMGFGAMTKKAKPAYNDLMDEFVGPEYIPAMLRRQESGGIPELPPMNKAELAQAEKDLFARFKGMEEFEIDPNFVSKPSKQQRFGMNDMALIDKLSARSK